MGGAEHAPETSIFRMAIDLKPLPSFNAYSASWQEWRTHVKVSCHEERRRQSQRCRPDAHGEPGHDVVVLDHGQRTICHRSNLTRRLEREALRVYRSRRNETIYLRSRDGCDRAQQ